MKKRLLCTILIMVIMFGATVPSYAEAWGTGDVTYVRNSLATIVAQILEINSKMGAIDGSGRTVWDNILLSINQLAGWLVPVGARPSSAATMLDSIVVLTNYAMNHLPDISVISGYVGSWMNTNNSYLNALRESLTNNWNSYSYNTTQDRWSKMAHYLLYPQDSTSAQYGWYQITMIGSDGNTYEQGVPWNGGTPIGNVALLVKWSNENNIRMHQDFMNKALTDYTGQLGIWDSQGETLTQDGWSPTSAINGLYKYLAYTQRDVARLTYVLASDEEIETREKARQNQEAVLDNFVDPEGSGSVSASNFSDIASASDSFKDNMNTGVSASGIFDVFNGDHISEWFSTETANELNNVRIGRRSLKASSPQPTYETPLLDAKMTELLGIFGGDGE